MTDASGDRATILAGRREPDARRPGAAEQACLRARGLAPDETEALHLLGTLALQAGRPREAALLIGQAVALRPGEAAYLCNLGEAHRALGEVTQALACQRLALALKPTLAVAHLNQALALQALGRQAEAAASYRQALALKPTLADAALGLGNLPATKGPTDGAGVSRSAHQVKLPLDPSTSGCGAALQSPASRVGPHAAARPGPRAGWGP